MLVVTNHGSNLSDSTLAKHRIAIAPIYVSADGELHDVVGMPRCEDIDRLIALSKAHPFVMGTSAADFVSSFRKWAREHEELVVVCSSRKLSGTYDASCAATRTLETLGVAQGLRIATIDSTTVDQGAGIITLLVCDMMRLGWTRDAITKHTNEFAKAGIVYVVPKTLEQLAKSGRAGFVRTLAGNILGRLPLIVTRQGELVGRTTVARQSDHAEAIVDEMVKDFGEGREIFAAVSHAKDLAGGQRLEQLIRSRFKVRELVFRDMTPAIYISAGPCIGAYALPTDVLKWDARLDP